MHERQDLPAGKIAMGGLGLVLAAALMHVALVPLQRWLGEPTSTPARLAAPVWVDEAARRARYEARIRQEDARVEAAMARVAKDGIRWRLGDPLPSQAPPGAHLITPTYAPPSQAPAEAPMDTPADRPGAP